MCSIVFSYCQHPRYRLILVANRDEFFERPSLAMHYWPEQPELLAGKDLLSGGSWLGLNHIGQFAAVTNYRDGTSRQQGRSRGQLITNYLDTSHTAADYAQQLSQQADSYNPFNLLLMDSEQFYYCSSQQAVIQALTPGLYGVSNAALDTPWPKLQAAKQQLAVAIDSQQLSLERLRQVLADEQIYPDELLPDTGISRDWERKLSAQFINFPGYGTRSRTLVLQDYDGKTQVLEISYGPEGPIEERSFQW